MPPTNLNIGGLVALGFDQTGRYLLTISHSGRGVFDTTNWQRVARDNTLAYPENGFVIGIGPIAGQRIQVTEIDYNRGILEAVSLQKDFSLSYESGIVSITLRRNKIMDYTD